MLRWPLMWSLALIPLAATAGDGNPSVGDWAAVVAVAVNLIGFIFVGLQLKAANKATENQTRWEIEQVSFNVYNMLVQRPTLRPYFYDKQALPVEEPARSRVLAASEMLLDYFEAIVRSGLLLDDESEAAWTSYMTQIYNASPSMAFFLEVECHRYTRDLVKLLDSPLAARLEKKLAAQSPQ